MVDENTWSKNSTTHPGPGLKTDYPFPLCSGPNNDKCKQSTKQNTAKNADDLISRNDFIAK